MPKNPNQKLKLLYLYKILMEKTDKNHGISIPNIQTILKEYNIVANRQVLYEDIQLLRDYGIDIKKYTVGRSTRYCVLNGKFQLAELKVLIDAVQASKFLTKQKTNDLITKLSSATNNFDKELLNRQVYVAGRIKNMNDSIYETTDVIHEAIATNKMINFQYFSWNIKKEMELRHDGAIYEVSPWALFWDHENYYMVAYDFSDRTIKHYRVDKMLNVTLSDKKRKGVKSFEKIDKSTYTQKHFGMFGGEETSVTLECTNDMANVIIDRFGTSVDIIPVDDEHFSVTTEIIMSDQFLGWIIALGDNVKLTGSEDAVYRLKYLLKSNLYKYE